MVKIGTIGNDTIYVKSDQNMGIEPAMYMVTLENNPNAKLIPLASLARFRPYEEIKLNIV